MNIEESPSGTSTGSRSDFPPSLGKLTDLLNNKVKIFQKTVSAEDQDERENPRGLQDHVTQSQELSSHLRDLQARTEQEVSGIHQQLEELNKQQDLLRTELRGLETQRNDTETLLQRSPHPTDRTALVQLQREVQVSARRKEEQAERLRLQEEALIALQGMLGEDIQRYQQEAQRLQDFSSKVSDVMQGENEHAMGSSTGAALKEAKRVSGSSVKHSMGLANGHRKSRSADGRTDGSSADGAKPAGVNWTSSLSKGSNLRRSGSVKDLIQKFSGGENGQASPTGSTTSSPTGSPVGTSDRSALKSGSDSELMEDRRGTPDRSASTQSNGDREGAPKQDPLPSIKVTPPGRGADPHSQGADSSTSRGVSRSRGGLPNGSEPGYGTGSESDFDTNKQTESPPSEEEAPNPRVTQNPKYQLFLGSDVIGNGSRDPDGTAGENGPRNSRWESSNSRFGPNHRGSLESLASRDWDTMSDRMGGLESPPRVFNSPYTSTSIDYNPGYRMAEYKVPDVLSPATSDLNLFGFNSRSTSPVPSPTGTLPRTRYSAYDTLRRREVVPNVLPMRPGIPNKRDYIEELTRQLSECQKRNQFLEAESVEMDKERNQIRFEMRGLLVNNEDLLRTNTQLQNELKRMRERMVEMERENHLMNERFVQLELEMKEAREVMVEANTQEYAFNFLQQSLKNKIQDAEEALEKQTQHAQGLSEKLWHMERELEELQIEKQTRDKKMAELSSNVVRLETELGEALKVSNQATAELNLQQKLKDDAEQRVEELEETLMEKSQELQRAQQIISRLQGEVSGKLIDKERTLEEEIQLRERAQLQCKQAERTVDDLQMELQTLAQSKEDVVKQLKQAQEKMIDLESDLEEMHDSEQRWATKHKRAIEQTEQLQLRLIQEKDLNEQLECEKAVLERQIRDLRVEVQELQTSMVQEDVVTRAENKVKELENTLRAEERNKIVMTNNIGKLERKVKELSDQLEEEHRLATEQKDLMAQRIRSLKRQLNEAEEEASRRETQYRHTQRELAEERETSGRLQRQLLDQHLKMKRNESQTVRQTMENLRLDLSVDDEDEPVTELRTATA